MKEIQPINQNVLLDISEEIQEQQTESGLILPDTAKEKESTGIVVAMSNIENPEISVGDRVIYKEYSGNEIKMDDKTYLLIQYSDILAKIVETEEI